MSTINNGGPAFPYRTSDASGMTLRDYFAAKALAGWLSTYATDAEHPAGDFSEPVWADNIASASYRIADAMLRARGAQ